MGLALRALGQKQAASERELVAAVRQGEDRAFEELFARYRSRITAYVLGMVKDHGRAEDVTQEVFVSALRRMRATERPIAFKPWIYEIARNACIDEFRRTRRGSELSLNSDEDSSGPERDLVSKQPTPDVALENKQRLEALRGHARDHVRDLGGPRDLEAVRAEVLERGGVQQLVERGDEVVDVRHGCLSSDSLGDWLLECPVPSAAGADGSSREIEF